MPTVTAIRLWRLWAASFKALVIARRGDRDTGLALLRNELNEAGDARYLPRFLFLLGRTLGVPRRGQ